MKKILLFIFTIFVVLPVNAQEDHFKFMGIPIDGKISVFNREIQKKGFSLDHSVGKEFDGYYIYNGVFAGEKANLMIGYNDKTKTVYVATVLIKRYSKDQALSLYKEMTSMVEEKYSKDEGVRYFEDLNRRWENDSVFQSMEHFEWKSVFDKDGYEETDFIIPDLNSKSILGVISLFVSETFSNISYTTEFNLYIRYTDWKNDDLYRANKREDL